VDRERVEQLWAKYSDEPVARWAAIASVPSIWLSIAWVDARFLLVIPLAALLLYVWFRYNPPRDEPDDFVL
jgi:hypothetical protein